MNLFRLHHFYYLVCLLVLTGVQFSVNADANKANPHAAMPADGQKVYGKVVETMDAGNYTYVRVSDGTKQHWAAGPKTSLKKGDMVAFSTQMPFNKFHSKALKRDFDVIYFVNRIITDKPEQAVANPHAAAVSEPHKGMKQQGQKEKISGIKKASKGKTVAEIFKQKNKLAGKQVRVRGKVVKYTPKVMGKNWLHIQDGSHSKNLPVTTKSEVKKGDVVLVSGKMVLDQDLGFGYVYEIVLEKASVKVE